MIETIISILVSVLIPGLILVIVSKKLNWQGVKLNFYISNMSQFNIPITNTDGSSSQNNIYIHTLTIRNNGNATAHNVDVCHFAWPLYHQITPFIPHEIISDPNTNIQKIIRFKHLGAGESVLISYIYNYPILPNHSIEYVRSEEGGAVAIPVILNRVFPIWLNKLSVILFFLGLLFIGVIIWWIMPLIIHLIKLSIELYSNTGR